VRTGLLVVGAAIALVGVGVLVASLSLTSGGTLTRLDTVSLPVVPGHSSSTQLLGGENQSSATLVLTWTSSQYLQVEVYTPGPCPHTSGVCPNGPPVASWWSDGGRWSVQGPASFPLIVNVTNPNSTSSSFSMTLLETAVPGTSNPGWLQYLPLVGAVVLFAIGGLAVFLGIFLRGGVYGGTGGARPPMDLDEEDDDDLGETGELDAPIEGEDPDDDDSG
jgi:hypothetical protein